MTFRGMAQLPTPTQIHEKLKTNQSDFNLCLWFPSLGKQQDILRKKNESLERTKVRHLQALKANKPGNKADIQVLPQAALAVVRAPEFYQLKSRNER